MVLLVMGVMEQVTQLTWLNISSSIDTHAWWCQDERSGVVPFHFLSFSRQEMKTKFPGSVAMLCIVDCAFHTSRFYSPSHRHLSPSVTGSFWHSQEAFELFVPAFLFPHLSFCPAVSNSASFLRRHCVTCPVLSPHQSPAALTLLCQLLS